MNTKIKAAKSSHVHSSSVKTKYRHSECTIQAPPSFTSPNTEDSLCIRRVHSSNSFPSNYQQNWEVDETRGVIFHTFIVNRIPWSTWKGMENATKCMCVCAEKAEKSTERTEQPSGTTAVVCGRVMMVSTERGKEKAKEKSSLHLKMGAFFPPKRLLPSFSSLLLDRHLLLPTVRKLRGQIIAICYQG